MKRKFLTLFVAFVILLAGCGTPSVGVEATPTPYPTPVKATFTVQRGDIAIDAKLTGRVSPLALHTVISRSAERSAKCLPMSTMW